MLVDRPLDAGTYELLQQEEEEEKCELLDLPLIKDPTFFTARPAPVKGKPRFSINPVFQMQSILCSFYACAHTCRSCLKL